MNYKSLYLGLAVPNIITDVILTLMPIYYIMGLRMKIGTRFKIGLVFSVGSM